MIHKRIALATVAGLTAALALTACGGGTDQALNTSANGNQPTVGGDYGAADNGATANGAADNGAADNGATDNGATDNGATDNGATDNGATDNGATDNGAIGNGAIGNGQGGAGGGAKVVDALVARKAKGVGTIVVDGKGWTLYRFDKDTAHPSKSNCNGVCAQKWPAVTANQAPQLKGVSRSLLGWVMRQDGTRQLTLAGWPLYRFSGDPAPGKWKGIGVGGTWWAIKPNGKKAAKCNPAMGNNGASNTSSTGSY